MTVEIEGETDEQYLERVRLEVETAYNETQAYVNSTHDIINSILIEIDYPEYENRIAQSYINLWKDVASKDCYYKAKMHGLSEIQRADGLLLDIQNLLKTIQLLKPILSKRNPMDFFNNGGADVTFDAEVIAILKANNCETYMNPEAIVVFLCEMFSFDVDKAEYMGSGSNKKVFAFAELPTVVIRTGFEIFCDRTIRDWPFSTDVEVSKFVIENGGADLVTRCQDLPYINAGICERVIRLEDFRKYSRVNYPEDLEKNNSDFHLLMTIIEEAKESNLMCTYKDGGVAIRYDQETGEPYGVWVEYDLGSSSDIRGIRGPFTVVTITSAVNASIPKVVRIPFHLIQKYSPTVYLQEI